VRTLKTRAIVLRRTNYGEADRIVQLLTPENGKVSAIAKGVRKEKSKLASGIELFSVSELTIHQGKSDLGTLTSVRLEHFYKDILADYDRLQFGYEVLKRANRLAEHIIEPALFESLEVVFRSLNDISIDLRLVKIWFYLHSAELEGRGLNLSLDSSGRQLREDARYSFDIADMAFVERPNGTFTSDHLKVLKLLKLKIPDIVAKVSGLASYLADCESLAHAIAE
jgi:DNA repair protein RecO (recombination protein O)